MNTFAYAEHIFFSALLQDGVFGNTLAWEEGVTYGVLKIPFPLDTLTGDIATKCVRTTIQ